MFIRFSMLTCVRSPGGVCAPFCESGACPHAPPHPTRRSNAIAPGTRTGNRLFQCFVHTANTPFFPREFSARDSPVLACQSAAISFAINVFLFWKCSWRFSVWSLMGACARSEQPGLYFFAECFHLDAQFPTASLPCLFSDCTRKAARVPSLDTRLVVFNTRKVRKIETSGDKRSTENMDKETGQENHQGSSPSK